MYNFCHKDFVFAMLFAVNLCVAVLIGVTRHLLDLTQRLVEVERGCADRKICTYIQWGKNIQANIKSYLIGCGKMITMRKLSVT